MLVCLISMSQPNRCALRKEEAGEKGLRIVIFHSGPLLA
jgi:hypothetical protein